MGTFLGLVFNFQMVLSPLTFRNWFDIFMEATCQLLDKWQVLGRFIRDLHTIHYPSFRSGLYFREHRTVTHKPWIMWEWWPDLTDLRWVGYRIHTMTVFDVSTLGRIRVWPFYPLVWPDLTGSQFPIITFFISTETKFTSKITKELYKHDQNQIEIW